MRQKGLLPLSANFDTRISAPIDSRSVVDYYADLILSSTWTSGDGTIYVYDGMIVSVVDDGSNNGVYRLSLKNPTDYQLHENWLKIGIGEIHINSTLRGDGSESDPYGINEAGLNDSDKYFINIHEKESIQTKKIIITKNGINGYFNTPLFIYDKNIQFESITLTSDCDSISMSIGGSIYNQTTIIGVTLNANTEMKILDINILPGNNSGTAFIKFKEI